MATSFYFHTITAPQGPTAKASTDTDSFSSVPADKNTAYFMNTEVGALVTSSGGVYNSGSTPLYTLNRIFVSPRLAAQVLTGGQANWTMNVGISESSNQMNLYHRFFVYIWRPITGNVKTVAGPTSAGEEHTSASATECVTTFSNAAGDFSILKGDRMVVELWFDIRNTKGTNYTATHYYDGTDTTFVDGTGTTSAGSFMLCPQTLTFARGRVYLTYPRG